MEALQDAIKVASSKPYGFVRPTRRGWRPEWIPCLRWVARERIHIPPKREEETHLQKCLGRGYVSFLHVFHVPKTEVITYVSNMDTAHVRKSPSQYKLQHHTPPTSQKLTKKSFDIRKLRSHSSGVIILPTQTMHYHRLIGEIPSKLPCICIVWGPQNGSHLMTPLLRDDLIHLFSTRRIQAISLILCESGSGQKTFQPPFPR